MSRQIVHATDESDQELSNPNNLRRGAIGDRSSLVSNLLTLNLEDRDYM